MREVAHRKHRALFGHVFWWMNMSTICMDMSTMYMDIGCVTHAVTLYGTGCMREFLISFDFS